jgi:DNA-binding Lrp family transcriptional regulator
MDDLDQKLLAVLRRNGRATYSDIAAKLRVTRTTVRTRIEKLEANGEISGYAALVKGDVMQLPVRALMMLFIEGHGTPKIIAQLSGISAVQYIHSTNGNWDLVIEIGTQTLAELDQILARIRLIEGVLKSETSILLSTRKIHKI